MPNTIKTVRPNRLLGSFAVPHVDRPVRVRLLRCAGSPAFLEFRPLNNREPVRVSIVALAATLLGKAPLVVGDESAKDDKAPYVQLAIL